MNVSRRDFLRISGAATAGLMMGSIFDLVPMKAYAVKNPPQWIQTTTSICCYCAVGCGILVGVTGDTSSDQATYVQGDPDHPINRGSLCSKGQAMGQLRTVDGNLNPRRLLTPKMRLPGGTDWIDISWTKAIDDIAVLIKNTRETTTEPADNRCVGIASLGGAAHDNEECYLLIKLLRALGLVYIEHQARI